MSDTASSSVPTADPTSPGESTTTTPEPTETSTPPPEETTTSQGETTTPTPEPTSETPTSTPVEPTTTSEPEPETTSTTEEPTSTTEEPSSTTEPEPEPEPETTTSTQDETSTTEPESSSTPGVTVITVTPTTSADTTITITTTSLNTDRSTTGLSSSSTQTSSSTSSSTISATAIPSTGGGGLSQPAKISIAIIIPIFSIILAFLAFFFWRRNKKRKNNAEERRKEVEEYNYNPNNDTSGPGPSALAAAGAANHGGDMAEMEAGYRGWGNTAGGRKASAPLSASAATSNTAGAGYGNTNYSGAVANGGQQYQPPQQPELYGSPALAGAVPVAVAGVTGAAALGATHSDDEATKNRDRHSHSPLLSSPTKRPSTADSSTIGAPATTGPSELDDGLHRGDSVASSRYTNATRQSEDSHELPGNDGRRNTYVSDGTDYYNDVANPYAVDYDYQEHAPEQGYHQPPMIQQVGARRNTRIENPPDTHYAQMPRQGTSGIAQNF
ncbi:hypothetical protein TWF481_004717 [Arthrobotrys musiformis]|uniref:Uncharacterized protein n=1 Tax=Arthrobotrys musiformis TaxID=47236 RepID=A0AAV9WKH9_9PEZI